MSKDKNRRAEQTMQKQHDLFMDTLIHMAGRSLEQALKDTFFRKRLMLNNQYRFYVSMDNNPIADMMIAKLDHEKAMLDIEEYQYMLQKTHEAVKNEAKAAVEEAIDELTKEFKSIMRLLPAAI